MFKDFYIYDIKEDLRQYSDDSDISLSHISFLIDDTRALLLRQKYKNPGSIIPSSIKQRLHFDLEITDDNEFISLDTLLRTTTALPKLVESADFMRDIQIDGGGLADIKVILVPNQRFPYIGFNRFLSNLIYTTLGQDYKLYFKAGNTRYKTLQKIRVFGVFENPKEAWEASANYDSDVDFNSEVDYPIDLDMWVQMKDIIMQQYMRAMQIPEDKQNNADEL
mgnify:CR=1 FL=1